MSTQGVKEQRIPASQFKARCLAILDEVAATGQSLIVTKRGKPVARLVSILDPEAPDLLGSVRYQEEADLLSPVDVPWEAEA